MIIYSYAYILEDETHGDTQTEVEDEEGEFEVAIYYQEDNAVYAESLISAQEAKVLVMMKCYELRQKFEKAYHDIYKAFVGDRVA